MSMVNNNKIFILAGETSGDLIGSYIMKGLKKNNKELFFSKRLISSLFKIEIIRFSLKEVPSFLLKSSEDILIIFYLQIRLIKKNINRKDKIKGYSFNIVGDKFNNFYNNHLKFE